MLSSHGGFISPVAVCSFALFLQLIQVSSIRQYVHDFEQSTMADGVVHRSIRLVGFGLIAQEFHRFEELLARNAIRGTEPIPCYQRCRSLLALPDAAVPV
jgi:hypothetical protein